MLQSMRHLAQSWVFKGLMVLLVASFGIWGVGDLFRSSAQDRNAAKVGNVKISAQELSREFNQTLTRARQSFGPDLSAAQAKALGMLDMSLNTLIERTQVDQQVDHLGINFTDKAVVNELMSHSEFVDQDGKLNKSLLRQMLERAHISEQEFMAQERADDARHLLLSTFNAETPLSSIASNTIYQARGQTRNFDIIILKNDSIKNVPVPDDQALQAFYQAHQQDYTAPEYRGLTIATLSADAVAKDINVTDEQVQKDYDEKGDQLTRPERRDLLQVVMQSEEKAKKLAEAAKASGNLSNTAKAMGYETVDLGDTDQDSLPSELAKPVFALSQGQVTDPIKSSLGWHVIEVRKILPAGKPSFAEIKDDLREAMRRDQAGDTVARLVNQLDDDLAAGHSLEDVADDLKLRLVKIPAVDATGHTPDGKAPPELPYAQQNLKEGFAQNSGETSPVQDDKQGNYFVVRTDSVTPSTLRPFDQVKDQVNAAWKAEQQSKLAAEQADKLVEALKSGKAASGFAGEPGITVQVSQPVDLLGHTDPALPANLMTQLMAMKKGDAATFIEGDHQLIVRLASVNPAALNATAQQAMDKQVQQQRKQELMQQYVKYLNQLYPPRINQDVVDSVVRSGG